MHLWAFDRSPGSAFILLCFHAAQIIYERIVRDEPNATFRSPLAQGDGLHWRLERICFTRPTQFQERRSRQACVRTTKTVFWYPDELRFRRSPVSWGSDR